MNAEHCAYFISRKKRYCRMTVKKGNQFCGEHQEMSTISADNTMTNTVKAVKEETDEKRIKCPLDPSHTCYKSKLAKHVKICNAKKVLDAQPEFIVKGINLDKTVLKIPEHIPLSQINNSIIDAVITKVNFAYEKIPEVQEAILKHDILKDILDTWSCGRSIRKHLLQNASLLAHLENSGLIQDDTCFIEFGAGKGKLTYWLAQIVKHKSNSHILLVDRSSHRHKSDNKLKNKEFPLEIKRIRADIADLQLNGITEIQNVKHRVGIAKHLCGAATDLTISCLLNAMENEPKCNISGIIIAFCCHHRCDYVSYVGKKYLERYHFTPDEFPILCSLASWATCGSGCDKEAKTLYNENSSNVGMNASFLTAEERTHIGQKVKLLLNQGRLEFLKSFSFQAKLLYYISMDVSLENMCIVGTCEHN